MKGTRCNCFTDSDGKLFDSVSNGWLNSLGESKVDVVDDPDTSSFDNGYKDGTNFDRDNALNDEVFLQVILRKLVAQVHVHDAKLLEILFGSLLEVRWLSEAHKHLVLDQALQEMRTVQLH